MSTPAAPPTPAWLRPRPPITSGSEYVESLRGRGLKVHFMGQRIAEPVDHPMIRPSINAVARTYDLANEDPALASAVIDATGRRVNRFLHVTESVADVVARRDGGVVIRGAKAHQTGCINSHWILVMPTMRLAAADRDYAIVCAVPVDDPGLRFVVGRQSCDTRALERGSVDQGNARFSGQEALILIDDVFVPDELVFMAGETGSAAELVERFTAFHRRSYVCKTGVGDVLIGAAALIADYNGVAQVSHVRDKLVEMTHLNETIYGAGIASSYESRPTPAGNYQNDELLANVCKHNVTRFPYELSRLAQDLAGGLVATLPSEQDFADAEIGPLLHRLLRGRAGTTAADRARVLRLIENMTLGRNAVGYLTESMHGAGSPQAQRIQIARQMQLEDKKQLARTLAGIGER